MRTIPRIGGKLWPVCLLLALILLLPMMATAQDDAADEGETPAGEAVEEAGFGGENNVEEEILTEPVALFEEIIKPVPQPEQLSFEKPAYVEVNDRRNDEGGAFAITWASSPSDETEGYEYRVYHASEIGNGTSNWEQTDSIPTNAQYIWQDPGNFGFFLSERNHGSNDHYSMYENYYPATGVYSYSISPDPENPVVAVPDPDDPDKFIPDPNGTPRLIVSARIFDERIEDWENLPVFADLRPFFGEKIQLEYMGLDPNQPSAPWNHVFQGNSPFIPQKVTTTKPYFILFTAPVRGMAKAVMEIQPDADDLGLVKIDASGNEQQVPDNRFQHYFRLYVVPAGYAIPSQIPYGPTDEGNLSIDNARVIAEAINVEYGSNPEFFITATVNQDGTLTLVNHHPDEETIYVHDPGGNATGLGSLNRIEGTNRWMTADPVGEGAMEEDMIHLSIRDLPPDEWMVGSEIGPMVANANIWNVSRTNSALWALLICAGVMGFILRARSGASLFLRRIAGLDHVEEAIGRATEMGRPILYTTGLGYVSDIATIASFNILGQVARKIADYETRLMVPSRDPIVMAVCQEVVQEAYIDAGRPDAYNKDDVFFLTDDQFAYTAAVDGIMVREKPATNFFMGMFYAESLLLAETGASTGAIQIAGTDALAQLPFFITACDYTLIGEELYAASAYLSREPLLMGSLKGQDFAKMILMIMTFVGTLLIFANIDFIKQLFQAF